MRIDPADCQLLVAHLQPALIAHSTTTAPAVIEASAAALVGFATALGVPVTFSLVPEDGETLPIAPLRPFVAADTLFANQAASPFLDPRVGARLDALQRRTLIVIGYAAEVVVLHAALDAIAAGYRVLAPIDVIGGNAANTERAALRQIAAAGGAITSTESLISFLAPNFSQPPGDMALAHLLALGEARRALSERSSPPTESPQP